MSPILLYMKHADRAVNAVKLHFYGQVLGGEHCHLHLLFPPLLLSSLLSMCKGYFNKTNI